eukprot:4193043-Pyramimonas_sp.AAC.1
MAMNVQALLAGQRRRLPRRTGPPRGPPAVPLVDSLPSRKSRRRAPARAFLQNAGGRGAKF